MLNNHELSMIFSKLEPIHKLHIKLRNELIQMFHKFTDDMCIGKTILEYVSNFSFSFKKRIFKKYLFCAIIWISV